MEFSYYSWGSVYVHQDFTESTGFWLSGIFLLFIERSFLLGPPNLPLTYRGIVYVHQDFTESTEKCCNFCAGLNHFLGVYRKNEDCHLLRFFHVLCRGVICFFCWCIFHGENCETKSPFFSFFQKSQNRRFCFVIFSMKNAVTEKNRVHHDEEHGKTKKMAVSDFSFLKLCHRDFCKTFS